MSCSDSNDYIKNVYVDIDIDLSLPEFSEINTVGNTIFIEGGNKGIIIYHYANFEYKIYDRNCDKCNTEIRTSYSTERKEIVYCEQCYQAEVV